MWYRLAKITYKNILDEMNNLRNLLLENFNKSAEDINFENGIPEVVKTFDEIKNIIDSYDDKKSNILGVNFVKKINLLNINNLTSEILKQIFDDILLEYKIKNINVHDTQQMMSAIVENFSIPIHQEYVKKIYMKFIENNELLNKYFRNIYNSKNILNVIFANEQYVSDDLINVINDENSSPEELDKKLQETYKLIKNKSTKDFIVKDSIIQAIENTNYKKAVKDHFIQLYRQLKEQNRNDLIEKYFSVITNDAGNSKLALLSHTLSVNEILVITPENLEEIYQKAEEEHNKKLSQKDYEAIKKIPYMNDEENIVYKFSDGYTIRRITLGNNILEGMKMNNCIRWAYHTECIENLDYLYYSLRNQENIPCVSFQVNENGVITEMKEYNNAEVTNLKWKNMINKFINSKEFREDIELLSNRRTILQKLKSQIDQLLQNREYDEVKEVIKDLDKQETVEIDGVKAPNDQLIKNAVWKYYIDKNYKYIIEQLKQDEWEFPIIYVKFLFDNILNKCVYESEIKSIKSKEDFNIEAINDLDFLIKKYTFYVEPEQLEDILYLSIDLFDELVIKKETPLTEDVKEHICCYMNELYKENKIDINVLLNKFEKKYNIKQLQINYLTAPLPILMHFLNNNKISINLSLNDIIQYLLVNLDNVSNDYLTFFDTCIEHRLINNKPLDLLANILKIGKLNSNISIYLFKKYFKDNIPPEFYHKDVKDEIIKYIATIPDIDIINKIIYLLIQTNNVKDVLQILPCAINMQNELLIDKIIKIIKENNLEYFVFDIILSTNDIKTVNRFLRLKNDLLYFTVNTLNNAIKTNNTKIVEKVINIGKDDLIILDDTLNHAIKTQNINIIDMVIKLIEERNYELPLDNNLLEDAINTKDKNIVVKIITFLEKQSKVYLSSFIMEKALEHFYNDFIVIDKLINLFEKNGKDAINGTCIFMCFLHLRITNKQIINRIINQVIKENKIVHLLTNLLEYALIHDEKRLIMMALQWAEQYKQIPITQKTLEIAIQNGNKNIINKIKKLMHERSFDDNKKK